MIRNGSRRSNIIMMMRSRGGFDSFSRAALLASSDWIHSSSFGSSSCFSTTTTSAPPVLDVLIVGGGVVGASLAQQLRQQAPSLQIGLVERGPGPIVTTKADNHSLLPHPRSYALSPPSLEWLQLLESAEGNESTTTSTTTSRLGFYDRMQVWEAGHPAALLFGAQEDLQAPHLGAVVEDSVIVEHLWKGLQQQQSPTNDNFKVWTHSHVTSLQLPQQATLGLAQVELETNNNDEEVSSSAPSTKTTLQAHLVVGADGGQSTIRRLAGIGRHLLEYNQHALTFTVQLKGPGHQKRAFQRFCNPDGILALLPTFSPHHGIVVWSTSPEQVQFYKQQPNENLLAHVNALLQQGPQHVAPLLAPHATTWPTPLAHLAYGVDKLLELAHVGPALLAQEGKFTLPPLLEDICSPTMSFPLSCAQALEYTKPRLALVGDAAHSVHPMAGQGLNLGLQDAAHLAKVVLRAQRAGMDLSLFVDEYEQSRKHQVSLTLAGIHALQRAFSTAPQHETLATSWKHVKSLGMHAIQNIGPIRRQLAQAACHGVALPKV